MSQIRVPFPPTLSFLIGFRHAGEDIDQIIASFTEVYPSSANYITNKEGCIDIEFKFDKPTGVQHSVLDFIKDKHGLIEFVAGALANPPR